MHCEVQTEVRDLTLHINIKGVLDYSTADNVQVDIPDGVKKMVVDLSELEFIDSTGIGAILSIVHTAGNRNNALTFEGLNDVAYEVFDTVGVFKIAEALLKGGE